jgi:hypothetical protein
MWWIECSYQVARDYDYCICCEWLVEHLRIVFVEQLRINFAIIRYAYHFFDADRNTYADAAPGSRSGTNAEQ